MELGALILPSDLRMLNADELESIMTNLDIDFEEKTKIEKVNEISNRLSQKDENTILELNKYSNKLFINGPTSWYKIDPKHLKNLANILKKSSFNPFENLLNVKEIDIKTDPLIYAAHDFKFIDCDKDSFLLRFVYKSRSVSQFDGLNYRVIPNFSFSNAIIMPNKGLIEIRASRSYRDRIARKIAELFDDDDVSISLFNIFSDLDNDSFNKKMKKFKGDTGSNLNESVDTADMSRVLGLARELDDNELSSISKLLNCIDNRILSIDDSDSDVNKTIDESPFFSEFPYTSFSALLLSGVSKIDLSSDSINSDLENSPMYKILRKVVKTKVNSVKVPITDQKVRGDYFVSLETLGDSVKYNYNSVEELGNVIRNNLVI